MKNIIITSVITISLSACTVNMVPSNYSGPSSTYNTVDTGKINTVKEGVITSARPVKIATQNGSIGTIAGAVAGGTAGNEIGKSIAKKHKNHKNTAKVLGTTAGVLLGGYLGSKTQETLSASDGIEYIVKLSNGELITLTQAADTVYSVGQSVYIMDGSNGSRARIVAK